MPNHDDPTPKAFKGVMVSSTFNGLEEHRNVLMDALRKQELFAIGMEDHLADPDDDEIAVSLKMVRKGTGYIGIISHRCGNIFECSRRNPLNHSICRLEFEEAQRLELPTLIFVMSENHPSLPREIENDQEKIKKLEAYRELAKQGRIYMPFDNMEDFTKKAIHAVAKLSRYLEDHAPLTSQPSPAAYPDPDPIPRPPAFYAEPSYLGSHQFVGRRDQLDTLDEWALPADAHPVLLFEAIGGTGKSLLTWEWVRHHAPAGRTEWAGRFWYSFYERGAIMEDFCRYALAYMTGQPMAELAKKKTRELAPQLLHQLQARPWLLVLDGLERVLVAYNRIDAAQLPDEEAGLTDAIAQRDPCAAIRPEDDDLLRLLATAAPSKLLLTSRLIPRVLLNSASQPIPGVLRERLPGLRPADAEALFLACGVKGDSTAIQTYLKTHCDCHPLTIGALAGLVTHYLPARGNFDKWCIAPDGGGKLNFTDLNLVQKRNHILNASIAELPQGSRRLLSMIAILSEAVDYQTLKAINPHQPPEIKEVEVPNKPEESRYWKHTPDNLKEKAKKDYTAALQRRAKYEQAVRARLQSAEYLVAPKRLAEAIEDLEKRGLLQYEAQAGHYNLHPVVRGIAAGGLASEEKESLGQRVVDHFSARSHNPYEHAETIADVRDGLHVVRTLVQMGRFEQAGMNFSGDLADALTFNLEAHAEIVAILRPFFPKGWDTKPLPMDKAKTCYLAIYAGIALRALGQETESIAASVGALTMSLELKDWPNVKGRLNNLSLLYSDRNRLAKVDLCLRLALDVAKLIDNPEVLFGARLSLFGLLAKLGKWQESEALWRSLDPMGRLWSRASNRPGDAEYIYATARFFRGELLEEDLTRAEHLAHQGRNRMVIRNLHALRGEWRLEQGEWALAMESLHEAVALAQAVGQSAPEAETQLALAKLHLGQLDEPHSVAALLAKTPKPEHLPLTALWLAIGDREQAKKHALAAYQWAWADGEPFVYRYGLDKARALLEQLGVEIPDLPPYDPAKDEKLPWEDAVLAAIEELRAEKAAEAAKAAAKPSQE